MQRYIFLHQVKTGGKTLEKYLLRKYGDRFARTTKLFDRESENNIFDILESPSDENLTKLNKSVVISGHVPFGLHRLLKEEYRYFTLLREPTARIRSYYAYSLNNPGSRMQAYLQSKNISFDAFVSLGRREIEESGVHELNYVLEDGQSKIIAGEDLRVGVDNADGLCQRADDNIAKYFDFVGITEQFDSSFVELNKLLNLSSFNLYITQNRSRVNVDVSDSAHEIMIQRNKSDMALYRKYHELLQRKSRKLSRKVASGYLKAGAFLADCYVAARS